MRNVDELLKEKEVAVDRLRREIAALRLAVPILHEEADFTFDNFVPGTGQERTNRITISDESEASPPQNTRSMPDDELKGNKNKEERSLLPQFGQAARGASRNFLKRVLDSRLLEREPQRKTIRDLFHWLGRTNAA